jgi:hypothetical protein
MRPSHHPHHRDWVAIGRVKLSLALDLQGNNAGFGDSDIILKG